jgi:hypothetical protein
MQVITLFAKTGFGMRLSVTNFWAKKVAVRYGAKGTDSPSPDNRDYRKLAHGRFPNLLRDTAECARILERKVLLACFRVAR